MNKASSIISSASTLMAHPNLNITSTDVYGIRKRKVHVGFLLKCKVEMMGLPPARIVAV